MNENEKDEVVQLYLDDIIPNRFQPREVFDEKALKELAVSIKEHGVIQPIIVRNVNGKYEIIAGERRYKASALAGQTKIPAIIRNLDDKESSKVALLENLQRKNLNAIEEARTYQKILELDQMTQEELAKTMGKSQSAVANKLRLLSLPDEIQEALLKEQISERHARALLNIDDANLQKDLLKKIISDKMSVRKLEEEINNMKEKPSENTPVVAANANGFLDNSPLTPTAVNVQEETSNYGKVIIAPPIEEGNDTGKFINYGEIGKENNNSDNSNLPEASQPVDIEQIKANASDINVSVDTNKTELDGLLNINSTPITPAEKIIKEEEEPENKPDDYFQTPDLTAIQIPIADTAVNNTNDTSSSVEQALAKVRELVESLKQQGLSVTADEMNFPKTCQIIIKIDKPQE